MKTTIEKRFNEYDNELKALRQKKYPATPDGRKRYVCDSLRTLPRSVNCPPKFLSSKDIVDTSFTVEKHHIDNMGTTDETPVWLECVFCIILSPILIPLLIGCAISLFWKSNRDRLSQVINEP